MPLPKILVNVCSGHPYQLRGVRDQTGLSVSEVVRRMFDYCLQPRVLNQVVPEASGRMEVGQ